MLLGKRAYGFCCQGSDKTSRASVGLILRQLFCFSYSYNLGPQIPLFHILSYLYYFVLFFLNNMARSTVRFPRIVAINGKNDVRHMTRKRAANGDDVRSCRAALSMILSYTCQQFCNFFLYLTLLKAVYTCDGFLVLEPRTLKFYSYTASCRNVGKSSWARTRKKNVLHSISCKR